MSSAAIWHEVECGGYAADLPVWEELASAAGDGLLELGCGSGRVALHLARRGHEVWAVDAEPALIEALEARAAAERLRVHALCADARALTIERDFGLIAAPMQLVQMLGGRSERRSLLERSAAQLAPRGRLAAAIVERSAASLERPSVALPDVRERDGWVYSSQPVAVADGDGGIEIRRLRQAVSPAGELSESEHVDRLVPLDAAELESEAAAAGLRPVGRLEVPAANGYLGAIVVVMEAG
jgi:SAM-dependent methyltransferase